MATNTTLNTAKAWHPDVQGFPALDVISPALILQVGTLAGRVEGDEPAVRVPFVSDDGAAGFVPEGEPIPENLAAFDEVVIRTSKVAALGKFSREAISQPNAAKLIVDSMQRSVITKADNAFLSNAADPAGLLATAGATDGGPIAQNLDALADAIVSIEADGGTATHILAAPDAWGSLYKLKSGTDSEQSLLGAGTEAAERRLLGVPVLSTSALTAGTVLVLDGSSIVTAYGDVMVARSDDAYFASDVVAVRVTFRCGWGVLKPQRVVSLTTGDGE